MYKFIILLLLVVTTTGKTPSQNAADSQADSEATKYGEILKVAIHNQEFKQYKPFVVDCFNENKQKLYEALTKSRGNLRKCGGGSKKVTLPLFDAIVDEIRYYLPKSFEALIKVWMCRSEECVDGGMDNFRNNLRNFFKFCFGKLQEIFTIYAKESEEVNGCAIDVYKAVLDDYTLFTADLRVCFVRKIFRL